ncbi:hypothetical protein KCP78_15035 [Salmonella enterica subsp. enterica]|nr:hypothetical protein KCP78_15035 [Salmonella enterica subsp. enterica]
MPAIADDSDAAVDVFRRAPGIYYSARAILAKTRRIGKSGKTAHTLRDVPDDKRRARFHCVLVYLRVMPRSHHRWSVVAGWRHYSPVTRKWQLAMIISSVPSGRQNRRGTDP